jgi:hypothetical protein
MEVGNIVDIHTSEGRDIRSEEGIVLTGMHFTLTGDVGKPEETDFERKYTQCPNQ